VLQCVAECCRVLQSVAVGLASKRACLHWAQVCSVLQCVVVCCSVLQCFAACCSVLQCVAVCCSVLQCDAVCLCVLRRVAESGRARLYEGQVLQCVAVCCSVLH